MTLLLIIAIVGVLIYFWPRLIMLMIIAPIIGTAFGGLVWGISSLIVPGLATLATFGVFMAFGIVMAIIVGIKLDCV